MTEDGLLRLQDWARQGLTDEQIAHNIGISKSTFYEWKKKYSDFSDFLKKGKEVVDIEVENALLKRALGYSYVEVKVKKENGIVVEETTTTKEVSPDPTSAIFWLKNRRPEQWREKREQQPEVQTNTEVDELSKSLLNLVKKSKEKEDDKQETT